MAEHQSTRTLVKSAPELWAECSDAASLARHLGAFGEIRITRLEPETTVAWEGAAASGTVSLEPSGWGTRVTLTMVQEEVTAVSPVAVAESEPEPEAAAEPVSAPEPVAVTTAPRLGMLARFRLRRRREPDQAEGCREPDRPADALPESVPPAIVETAPASPEPAIEVAPVAASEDALAAALDSLGRAHHRPYSRS